VQQSPSPASVAPTTAQDDGAVDAPTSAQVPDTSTPNVRFNSGLLDFGINEPVNNNDWRVSWVGGSSKPAGNDWKVLLP